jgi:hypothetical protein
LRRQPGIARITVNIAALAWLAPPLMVCIAFCRAQIGIIGVSPVDIFDAAS